MATRRLPVISHSGLPSGVDLYPDGLDTSEGMYVFAWELRIRARAAQAEADRLHGFASAAFRRSAIMRNQERAASVQEPAS